MQDDLGVGSNKWSLLLLCSLNVNTLTSDTTDPLPRHSVVCSSSHRTLCRVSIWPKTALFSNSDAPFVWCVPQGIQCIHVHLHCPAAASPFLQQFRWLFI
jgi:hypothetical protein